LRLNYLRMTIAEEIKRRRTFAIISHPDAGKTTLTEKLLLFGGAIHVAGAVKSNKIKKTTTSDFMEIEKQRGISVATSVMGFEYRDCKINILDTPGHQDFAEDTFRTLTAVDSVIIVIDAAKGVESQTEKLMEVARMRNTPVIIFVNKLDRPGKDPFELLDDLEKSLKIGVRPLSWPISMGPTFKGVYNIYESKLFLFTSVDKQTRGHIIELNDLNDPQLEKYISPYAENLRNDLELVEGVYPEFQKEDYLAGKLAPVFFGSALNNFGVKELLDCFLDIAPPPKDIHAQERLVKPDEKNFSGFVFKIHANLDPNHRDRIAFVKICSGIFERNKPYMLVRSGKNYKFSNPTSFMADKKSVIDEAFPGDIVGIHDTGNFKIGDTLTEGEKINFKGIPNFSPEFFRYVENADPLKFKQLAKGLDHLTDEGVAQLFINKSNGRRIIGTVGPLQFDVIQFRLEHEYGAKCRYESIQLHKACWIESSNKKELADFLNRKYQFIAEDKNGNNVFLAESPYALKMAIDKFPDISFKFSSEVR
jgi:peptide chain release factor 3